MKKKTISVLLILAGLLSYPVQARSEEIVKTEEITLTLEEAITKGIENSLSMDKVENQAKIASLVSKNAETKKDDIIDAEIDLLNAESSLYSGRNTVYRSQDQLDSAQAQLDNGIAPMDIPDPVTGGIISKGTDLNSLPYGDKLIDAIQEELDEKRSQLGDAMKDLDEGSEEYLSSKSKYDSTLQFAMTKISNTFSTSTISSLEPDPLATLLDEMAEVQDRLTHYSISIYKSQIALQIQNSYFEALKQIKLMDAKQKAMERGKLQFEFADYAYEVGAKSKDDRNLAKLYYDSTVIAYDLQVKETNNALIELKKNLNMPFDTNLTLEEEPLDIEKSFDLTKGISSGLNARLEVKKARAQVELYHDLKTAVKNSHYEEGDNEYKEADLLVKKVEIESKETKLQVESSIRKSYETVTAMDKVARQAQQLKENAEETVEIAKLKYEVGFGADNALLTQLNLQDVSGTMVEVIAAEENLASVEQKVIEATNGYNLAKVKYFNDIGVLPYK